MNIIKSNNDKNENNYLSYESIPLKKGTGTHYVELYIGTPPQKASVIVDTGSSLTATPCKNCDSCGEHTDPKYDLNISTTYEYLPCNHESECDECNNNQKCIISESYSEGSTWKAIMVEDFAWFGDPNNLTNNTNFEKYSVKYPIGCQIEETGIFTNQIANGIMGLSHDTNSIIDRLYQSGKLEHNIFSLCFSRNGGQMFIGGFNDSIHNGNIEYVPYINDTGYYQVHIVDILINERSIAMPESLINRGTKGVIVDSGTTDSYFPEEIGESFQRLFLKITGFEYGLINKNNQLNDDDFKNLPNIQFKIKGFHNNIVTLTIPPTNYMSFYRKSGYVPTIHFKSSTGGIIGANMMMNHNYVFDKENQRIGITSANCSNTLEDDIDFERLKNSSSRFGFLIFICVTSFLVTVLLYSLSILLRRNSLKDIAKFDPRRKSSAMKFEKVKLADNGDSEDDNDDDDGGEIDIDIESNEYSDSKVSENGAE